MRLLMIGNVPLDSRLGSGKTRIQWSEGLKKLGHQVDVWEPKDYEWRYGTRTPAKKLRQSWGSWHKSRQSKINQGYDAVLLYGDEFWSISSWLRKQLPRPFIISGSDGVEIIMMERLWAMEGAPENWKKQLRRWWDQFLYYPLSKKAFRQTEALICGSGGDVEEMIRRGYYERNQTAVIPPGVDPYLLQDREGKERTISIAFNGSWIARKGIDLFVRVTSSILKNKTSVQIAVLGTGMRANEIQSLYSESVRSQVIVYPPHDSRELREVLDKTKVFFLPTQYEGFGMATSEAMACGCVVVTTPTGFGAELVSGQEGLIFEFNDEKGMEKGILDLLDNESQWQRISLEGRKKVSQFYWENSIRELERNMIAWTNDKKDQNSKTKRL